MEIIRRLRSSQPITDLLNYQNLLTLLIFVIIWLVVLGVSGTITSGYHFIDDHEFVRMHQDLVDKNDFQVVSDWVSRDLEIRFRPLYYVHRVLLVKAAGLNFPLMAAYQLLMAVGTAWLLYLFARKLQYSQIASVLLPAITLIGSQAAIWWRLGPSENIGMFCFAASLYFLSCWNQSQFRNKWYKFGWLAMLIAASLIKESFILMIPSSVFIYLWIQYPNRSSSLWKLLQQNLGIILGLAAICLVEVYIIFSSVGASSIGYAGVDSQSLGIRGILSTIRDVASNQEWYAIGSLCVIAVIVTVFVNRQLLSNWRKLLTQNKRLLQDVLIMALLFAAILLPQGVLYAKSGIYERYLIPVTFGLAYLVVFVVNRTRTLLAGNQILRLGVMVLMLLLILPILRINLQSAYLNAQIFAADGQVTNAAIDQLTSKLQTDAQVLIMMDPAYNFEASQSLHYYLTIAKGLTNVSVFSIKPQNGYASAFLTELAAYFESSIIGASAWDASRPISQVSRIFIFGEAYSSYQSNTVRVFNLNDFQCSESGSYLVCHGK